MASYQQLKSLIDVYKKSLINRRIENIVLVNSRLFLFTLKNEKYKLLVDLDNNQPHIGLINTDYDELTLPSDFIAKALNKGRPLIKDIELVNSDKVIKITTTASDAYYHINEYHLYIELINARANMILTDSNDKIIAAFYETNLSAPRLIIRNNKYVLPTKKNEEIIGAPLVIKEYEKYVSDAFNKALVKRKKELYGDICKKYEKRLKALERKIIKINESKEKANQALIYKDYGETLLMHLNEIHKGDKAYSNITLDTSKSASENANLYFYKYKKAKRTLETIDTFISDANKEIENCRYYLDVFKYGSEKDIELLLHLNDKKAEKRREERAYLPYYINHNNTIYYYGHNALENDYLTFKMFKNSSTVTWLHLKDQPGAHLIINKSEPSNEELHIAANLLLLLNKQTAGEIMYAKRADITRDNQLANVNVKRYKIINMHRFDQAVASLIKKEKRVHE